jgi:hypothetical protein
MTLKMNADIKEQWLAALRSGEYEQGTGMLHRVGQDGAPDRFCCLGVLSHLAHKAGIIDKRMMTDEKGDTYYSYGSDAAYMPQQVCDWAGVEWDDERAEMYDVTQYEAAGRYMPAGECTLAKANDRGEAFEEIADTIEKFVVGV